LVTLFLENGVIKTGILLDSACLESNLAVNLGNTRTTRPQKRKRFFDEESEITDVKKVLRNYDSSMRVSYGEQIIQL
ncbi:unnamed protein product, partial [Allacma fusca]